MPSSPLSLTHDNRNTADTAGTGPTNRRNIGRSRVPLRRIGIEVGILGPAKAGVARYLWNMVRELMLLAPEVEILFYSAWPVEIPLAPGNWRLRESHGISRRVFQLWVQTGLPRLLAADRVDVFWGQGYAVPQRGTGGCARVLTVHDLTPMLFPNSMERRTRMSYGLFMPGAARSADAVVAVSQATARLARLLLGVKPESMTVIYEGVDPSFVRMGRDAARRHVLTAFGLSGDFVLCVGTVEPRKNLQVLLDAVGSMDKPPTLVLAGAPGWRCQTMMAAIRAAELAGGVKYLGPVDDVELAALYSSARLLVYPSLYEGFGLPVLEAMACGCPVLCSWSSSLPEVGGRAARYFRPRDVRDLSERLARLLSDDRELDRMSRDGLLQAAAFSYSKAAQELLVLFRSLAGRRSADPRSS